MAVIVTGMDMPESCKRCPIRYDCYRWIRYLQTQTTTACNPQMEGCPLKSVDGLIKKIEQQQKVISLLKGLSGAEEMKGMNDCIKIIKEYCGMEESNG